MMDDITVRRPLHWECAADTNVGIVRKINEDSILSRPEAGLWVVADGMGGYEAGNVASNIIVSSLQNISQPEYLSDFVEEVEQRILDANQKILEYADIMHDGRILGSTIAGLLIKGQVGICLWAGDSRVYRYRNNTLEQITRDHSYVQEMLRQGKITEEQALSHPDSNVITRAVGSSVDLCLDITAFNACQGDTFLLCSDGLYNAVPENEIAQYLRDSRPDTAVKELIIKSLEKGAPDNVSVIIVKGVTKNRESH